MRVATAITTAPRAVSYLQKTLRSISSAGFDIDLIAADCGKYIVEGDIPVLCSDVRLGSQGNFLAALDVLLTCDVEAILVFEDDIRVARGLRKWLDTALWPDDPDEIGAISLYTPSQDHFGLSGWFRYDLTPTDMDKAPFRRLSGACAYLMPFKSALRYARECRFDRKLTRDRAMAQWCQNAGLGYIAHTPSLVEHIGAVSAVRETVACTRQARIFVEDVEEMRIGRSAELEEAVSPTSDC